MSEAKQMNLEIDCEEKKITRLVEVRLQPAQLAILKEEARTTLAEMKRLDGEFEVKKKEFNAEYNKLEAALFTIIEKQTESQEVECKQKMFFNNNLVQVFHGDEMIEERALTAEERQMAFGDVKHGVVLDSDRVDSNSEEPLTEEEAKQDLQDTMREERSPNKPSLVDLK